MPIDVVTGVYLTITADTPEGKTVNVGVVKSLLLNLRLYFENTSLKDTDTGVLTVCEWTHGDHPTILG